MLCLSPRERDIITYMAQGLNNQEIADKLLISKHTVKAYISAILKKLPASDRTNIVYKAVKSNLID